jgi:hypothetical protein
MSLLLPIWKRPPLEENLATCPKIVTECKHMPGHNIPPHLETQNTHQLADDLHCQVERQQKLLGKTGWAVYVLYHRLAQEDPHP